MSGAVDHSVTDLTSDGEGLDVLACPEFVGDRDGPLLSGFIFSRDGVGHGAGEVVGRISTDLRIGPHRCGGVTGEFKCGD